MNSWRVWDATWGQMRKITSVGIWLARVHSSSSSSSWPSVEWNSNVTCQHTKTVHWTQLVMVITIGGLIFAFSFLHSLCFDTFQSEGMLGHQTALRRCCFVQSVSRIAGKWHFSDSIRFVFTYSLQIVNSSAAFRLWPNFSPFLALLAHLHYHHNWHCVEWSVSLNMCRCVSVQ